MTVLLRIQTLLTGLVGGPGLSTFHFLASAGSGQEAQNAVDAFWASIDGWISSTITATPMNEVVAFEDTTGEAVSFTPSNGIGNTGDAVGTPLPPATQGMIKWPTGAVVGGRRLQGRTFIPGPTEDHSEGSGVPNAAYVAALATAGDALLNGVNSTPVVWSRPKIDPETGAVIRPGSYAEITDAVGWTKWAVLRGRRDA